MFIKGRLHNIFLIILLFLQHSVQGQHLQNNLDPNNYKPSKVELGRNFLKLKNLNTKFIFIDERDDTTRMGFFWGDNHQYYFTFSRPAAEYLSERFNIEKNGYSNDTFYIGIKRLWISQADIPSSLARSILLSSKITIGYCRVICNFYKKLNSNYSLIYKYDSIISKRGYLGNTHDKLMEESLFAMLSMAVSMNNMKTFSSSSAQNSYPGKELKRPIIYHLKN